MPSPFPGMDPYLEDPRLWPDVHHEILSVARERLGGQLRPKYSVRIEERVYLSDLLDDEIHEARLEVIDREQRLVVTVIEVLSPTNKVEGARGRESFEEKRNEVIVSPSHWVEIDLLRGDASYPLYEALPPHEYRVVVSRVALRPDGWIWPIRLSQRLPVVPIPLKPEDPDVPLDLQAVLATAYDRAGYDLEIDYKTEPLPPLSGDWADWARRLLQGKGLRPS